MHNIWAGSPAEPPAVGDTVMNEYGNSGVVQKVTANWVLTDEDGERWIHRERFEDAAWTVL